jgi:hypothetical protein
LNAGSLKNILCALWVLVEKKKILPFWAFEKRAVTEHRGENRKNRAQQKRKMKTEKRKKKQITDKLTTTEEHRRQLVVTRHQEADRTNN